MSVESGAETRSSGALQRIRDRLGISALLRKLTGDSAQPGVVEGQVSDLTADELRKRIEYCADNTVDEVTARKRTGELGNTYIGLSDNSRRDFFRVLAADFDRDHEEVRRRAAALAGSAPGADPTKLESDLEASLVTPRSAILRRLNSLPEAGFKLLVDMRAELRSLINKQRASISSLPGTTSSEHVAALNKENSALQGLEDDLKGILSTWCDVGFLKLERITLKTSGEILDKLIQYETVQKINGWDDLKNRLDTNDRRVYAFFHPSMPTEPLIFVEVALTENLAGGIQPILDIHAPVLDGKKAKAAMFYSINSALRGLDGITFGNELIKSVADELQKDGEIPNVNTYSTLSPAYAPPMSFRRWLDPLLEKAEGTVLLESEKQKINVTGNAPGTDPELALLGVLRTNKWHEDEKVAEAIKPILMRLAAQYLLVQKTPGRNGKAPTAFDSVAHFHLGNGARVERINWLGDTSERGMREAAGIMVNYRYVEDNIQANQDKYNSGEIAAVPEVRNLLGKEGERAAPEGDDATDRPSLIDRITGGRRGGTQNATVVRR